MDCRDRIIREVADEARKRLCRQAIRAMQQITDCLSGDDSEFLANAWDEICVQVQYEPSIFWDLYEETLSSVLRKFVKELPKHQLRALWLQTKPGQDWCWARENNRRWDWEDGLDYSETSKKASEEPEIPDEISQVEEFVLGHVLDRAESYSNQRIERYMECQYG